MPYRHPRFLSGRNLEAGDAKAMLVMPFWKNERPFNLELFWRFLTDDDVNPDRAVEYNVDVLALPFTLAENFASLTGADSNPVLPNSATQWDNLYEHYVFTIGTDERYYGGESGQSPSDTTNVDERVAPDPTEDQTDDTAGFDPNRSIFESFPPSDARSLFRAEPICRLMTVEGEDKARWGDEGRMTLDLSEAMFPAEGGLIIVGARRYEPDTDRDENFSVTSNAGTRSIITQLRTGMYKLIQERISKGSTDVDDWVRTQLFDGDTFIAENTWSDQAGVMQCKARMGIATPFSRFTL